MSLKEDVLQQQLQSAQSRLAQIEQTLPAGAVPKKHPFWRNANAAVRQIQERLSTRQLIQSGGVAKKAKSEEDGETSE